MLSAQSQLYSGFAQIHLEGKNALTPREGFTQNEVIYNLGSNSSQFRIIDHRKEVNLMAANAISNAGKNWSPQLFCIPSYVEAIATQNGIDIHFSEWKGPVQDFPILWAGVFEGDVIHANPVRWLELSESGDGRTAFISIVDLGEE